VKNRYAYVFLSLRHIVTREKPLRPPPAHTVTIKRSAVAERPRDALCRWKFANYSTSFEIIVYRWSCRACISYCIVYCNRNCLYLVPFLRYLTLNNSVPLNIGLHHSRSLNIVEFDGSYTSSCSSSIVSFPRWNKLSVENRDFFHTPYVTTVPPGGNGCEYFRAIFNNRARSMTS